MEEEGKKGKKVRTGRAPAVPGAVLGRLWAPLCLQERGSTSPPDGGCPGWGPQLVGLKPS